MQVKSIFRYTNTAVASIALFAFVGYISTQMQKPALANVTCANVIDETAPCPSYYAGSGWINRGYKCKQSAAFYDPIDIFHTNPYYGCCIYEATTLACWIEHDNYSDYDPRGNKYYFRSSSTGAASCINEECINQ